MRPRTKVSIRTSAGTALTASPPLVMMGWTRILSSSRKVSRLKLMAVKAIVAAFRALMPRCGAPPAWEARPMNWMRLATVPLLVLLMHICFSTGLLVVWSIMARWMSSNSPSRTSSGLPPKNSIFPSRRSPSRYSISMYSSAGTAMNARRPDRESRTLGLVRAAAAPSIMPIWQWCPQAWAALVSRSACG